ncbi:hypothetical protein MNB_SUP05-SYMBIONT-7-114 [hydrothermal vent metagenome]|uniref:Uncharacterized protein n=1 Tax=hydrothermal vent metagenome TaxID=652676 RepID=A0A1W1E6G7_9ZZZZ
MIAGVEKQPAKNKDKNKGNNKKVILSIITLKRPDKRPPLGR